MIRFGGGGAARWRVASAAATISAPRVREKEEGDVGIFFSPGSVAFKKNYRNVLLYGTVGLADQFLFCEGFFVKWRGDRRGGTVGSGIDGAEMCVNCVFNILESVRTCPFLHRRKYED